MSLGPEQSQSQSQSCIHLGDFSQICFIIIGFLVTHFTSKPANFSVGSTLIKFMRHDISALCLFCWKVTWLRGRKGLRLYFSEKDDRAACNVRKRVISSKGGNPSNMLKHLSMQHVWHATHKSDYLDMPVILKRNCVFCPFCPPY